MSGGRHRATTPRHNRLGRGIMVLSGWVAGLGLTVLAVPTIGTAAALQAARTRAGRRRPVVFQAGQHR